MMSGGGNVNKYQTDGLKELLHLIYELYCRLFWDLNILRIFYKRESVRNFGFLDGVDLDKPLRA